MLSYSALTNRVAAIAGIHLELLLQPGMAGMALLCPIKPRAIGWADDRKPNILNKLFDLQGNQYIKANWLRNVGLHVV